MVMKCNKFNKGITSTVYIFQNMHKKGYNDELGKKRNFVG